MFTSLESEVNTSQASRIHRQKAQTCPSPALFRKVHDKRTGCISSSHNLHKFFFGEPQLREYTPHIRVRRIFCFAFSSHSTCEIERAGWKITQFLQAYEGAEFESHMGTFRCYVSPSFSTSRLPEIKRAGGRELLITESLKSMLLEFSVTVVKYLE